MIRSITKKREDLNEANCRLKNSNGEGEGGIRYKTDKLLEGRAMVDGKTITVYVSAIGINDKKAEEKTRKQLKKAISHLNETGVVDSKMRLQDCMLKWVESRNKLKRLRVKSYGDYINIIKTQIFGTEIGRTQISLLKTTDLEEFYVDKLEKGRIPIKRSTKLPKSPRNFKVPRVPKKSKVPKVPTTELSLGTIKKMHALIRASLYYALKKDWISRNVAELADLPLEAVELDEKGQVVEKVIYSAFSDEERVTFLNAVKRSNLYVIFLTMFYTGMRVGEVLALKWRNVDLEKGEIHVRESLQRVKTPNGPQKTKLTIGPPKTRAGRRTIPLTKILVEELIKYREKQNETKENWGEAYHDKDIVFSIENGNYREPRNFTRSYYDIRDKSGVRPINLHGIRHTFASMLLTKKIHVKIVSCLLGHSVVSLTINTYIHIFPEIKIAAIEAIDDYSFTKIKDELNNLQVN